MTVFSKKNSVVQNKESIFVGAFLPLPLNSYLTLYTLATSQCKSQVINTMIGNWVKEMEANHGVSQLVREVVFRVKESLEIRKTKKGFTILKFMSDLKQELTRKGVEQKWILEILKELRDAKND